MISAMVIVLLDHVNAPPAELSHGEQVKAVGYQIGNHGVVHVYPALQRATSPEVHHAPRCEGTDCDILAKLLRQHCRRRSVITLKHHEALVATDRSQFDHVG